jgi:hypothetical protein
VTLRRLTTAKEVRDLGGTTLEEEVRAPRKRSGAAGPKPPVTSLGLNRKVKAWLSLRRQGLRSHGFHPSELARMCPVQHYFTDEAHVGLGSDNPATVRKSFAYFEAMLAGKTREFGPELRMEMRKGDDIHDDVKFELGVLGLLWGAWSCAHCDAKVPVGWMPRVETRDINGEPLLDAASCLACNGRNRRYDEPWLYQEPAVRNDEWGVVGSVDGDLRITTDGVERSFVLEIKSINEAGFDGKYGGPLPKPEHVLQASIYAWILGRSHIYFIYVSKNQNNRWKEIIVARDDEAINAAKVKMRIVQEARVAGAPPIAHRACPGIEDARARLCPAVEACFGAKPPANFWKGEM